MIAIDILTLSWPMLNNLCHKLTYIIQCNTGVQYVCLVYTFNHLSRKQYILNTNEKSNKK